MTDSDIRVRDADWDRDQATLREVRTEVFVVGQDVTVEEEWDGLDERCQHVIAYDGDEAVGTGRLDVDGCIGRMAVREAWRGKGAGTAVLRALIAKARAAGMEKVYLGSQMHAIPFYARLGFVAYGEVYMDARIPHRKMTLTL